MLAVPDRSTLKGKGDYVILALQVGPFCSCALSSRCGFRSNRNRGDGGSPLIAESSSILTRATGANRTDLRDCLQTPSFRPKALRIAVSLCFRPQCLQEQAARGDWFRTRRRISRPELDHGHPQIPHCRDLRRCQSALHRRQRPDQCRLHAHRHEGRI